MAGYNPPEASMLTRGAISRLPDMSPNELSGSLRLPTLYSIVTCVVFTLYSLAFLADTFQPVLQITAVAAMGTAENGVRRLRVVLSDGTHCSSAMPFGHLIQRNVQFRQYALCRCTFSSANVKGKHVFLIKEFEEVCPPLRDAIGNPASYRPSSAVANNAANENVPSRANGMGQQPPRAQLQHYPTIDGPTPQSGGYPQYGGPAATGYHQQPQPQQHQQYQPPSGGGGSISGAGSSAASSGRQLPTFMQQQRQPQQQQHNQHKVTGPPLRANPTNPYQHNSNQQQQQQQQPMGGGMLSRQQTVSLGGNPQQSRPMQQHQQPGQQQHYGGPQQHQHHSTGPVSYRPVASDIIPISQLSVYSQKWTIKGRVSSKSDVRTFNNARGEGQLFSIELVDDQSAEIRATFFNSAVTKFFPAIQQGKVYTFSKGQVKQANARFNPGAAYELTFNDDAIIEESTDSADIPRILYKISKIATIQDRNPDEFVDLCGIVTHCSPISTVVIRNSGQERARRNFTIADDSGCSIEMTVWGDTAQHCGIDENRAQFNPVVMIKNARISNYGGKSLTTASTTTLEVDPDDSRAFEVKNWWIQGGQTGAMQALSTGGAGGGGNAPKTVIDVMRMDNNLYLSLNGQAASDVPNARPVNTHTIQRATVAQIFRSGEKPLYYTSCITEIPDGRGGVRKCSKKVEQDISTGTWSCIDGHQNPQCMPRYIINLKLADISGEVLVRAFDDQAQALLGVAAQDMMNGMGEDEIEALVNSTQFKKINVRLRSKKEVYTDEERVNVSMTDFTPITDQNLQQDAKQMMDLLDKYLQTVDPNGSRN